MLFESVAVESVILATLVLYSRLMTNSAKNIYCPTGLWDTKDVNQDLTLGLWGNNYCTDSVFPQEKPIRGQNASITAKEIRDANAKYFMNERQFSGNGANVE